MLITFNAPIWLWSGKSAWHFITVPPDEAMLIRLAQPRGGPRRGWGAVRVKARIGETSWSTSIFPDSKSGSYLLPIKSEVRRKEALSVGALAEVTLSLDV